MRYAVREAAAQTIACGTGLLPAIVRPDTSITSIPRSPHPNAEAVRTNTYSPSCPSDQSPATTGYAPPTASTPIITLTVEADAGDPRTAFPSEIIGYNTTMNPNTARRKSTVADTQETTPRSAITITTFRVGTMRHLWSVRNQKIGKLHDRYAPCILQRFNELPSFCHKWRAEYRACSQHRLTIENEQAGVYLAAAQRVDELLSQASC